MKKLSTGRIKTPAPTAPVARPAPAKILLLSRVISDVTFLGGDLGGGISWQRFIARLVAHGPVNTLVPGSILQEAKGTYTILGNVASDMEISMR